MVSRKQHPVPVDARDHRAVVDNRILAALLKEPLLEGWEGPRGAWPEFCAIEDLTGDQRAKLLALDRPTRLQAMAAVFARADWRSTHPDDDEPYGFGDLDGQGEVIAQIDDDGGLHPDGRLRDDSLGPDMVAAVGVEILCDGFVQLSAWSLEDRYRFKITDWPIVKRAHDHACVYCGATDVKLQMEHVEPQSKGGQHTWENIVPACKPCNVSKLDRDVVDWLNKRGEEFKKAAVSRLSAGRARVEELIEERDRKSEQASLGGTAI